MQPIPGATNWNTVRNHPQRNHNLHPSPVRQRVQPQILRINDAVNDLPPRQNVISPMTSDSRKPKQEIDKAIDKLAGDMDIFEQEQLLRKKN